MLTDNQIKVLEEFGAKLYDEGKHVKAAQIIERLLDFYKKHTESIDCYRCGRSNADDGRTMQHICECCVSEFDERSSEYDTSEQAIADLNKELHETQDSHCSCHDRMEDAEAKVKAIMCLLDGRAKAQNVILEAAGFER